jgi:hypothetical protein
MCSMFTKDIYVDLSKSKTEKNKKIKHAEVLFFLNMANNNNVSMI